MKKYNRYTNQAMNANRELANQVRADAIAGQQPYIDAGKNAFGLKGTLNLDDTQFAQDYYAKQAGMQQGAINAGVANAGGTPEQQAALREYLGQLQPTYSDYNKSYANELQNRMNYVGLVDEGAAGLRKQGLGALGASTGVGLDVNKYMAGSTTSAYDQMMGARLAGQQADALTKGSRYGLYGSLLNAGAQAYDSNWFGGQQPEVPQPTSGYSAFDTPYQTTTNFGIRYQP